MLPALVVFLYLAIVLYVGIFAFRKRTQSKEEFFVANRSLGTFVFLMSLFGSNMTSFAILGSSGLAFRQGIGVYGLMASISGLVIPTSIFLIGTRLWAMGKKHGYITQVQFLRDRFDMNHIGTVVFALQAIMLVPYIIIGVMGGGETLAGVSDGAVPYAVGGAVVALVVMSYVFFGGMRGTAWVNTLQTCMFLVFGSIAFIIIARGMGGIGSTAQQMAATLDAPPNLPVDATPAQFETAQRLSDGALLTRHRIGFWYYVSYMFIPLSSIMFPHIAIFCLTAKKLASFKRTVILYPLCIMAIWAPAVFLGAMAGSQPNVIASLALTSEEGQRWVQSVNMPNVGGDAVTSASTPATPLRLQTLLAQSKHPAAAALLADLQQGTIDKPTLGARLAQVEDRTIRAELRRLASTNADGVMLVMLNAFAPWFLAGLLGAAIMACVMASDSQILALSTMFSEDVFAHYGHKQRFGETAQVWAARIFVVVLTIIAYIIALVVHQYANIFEIAIQYAFSGYASMAPIMLAALFWRRATKWGVLASTLWIFIALVGSALMQAQSNHLMPTVPGGANVLWQVGDFVVFMREGTRISFTQARMLLVAPMFIMSCLLMVGVSLLTRAPDREKLAKFFAA